MIEALAASLGNEADRESDGNVHGLAIGVVTNNEDPEGLARVRVRLPWQAESEESFWARLVVPMALSSQGTYFLPEIDTQVLCGFERGDLTHPCVLGCLWTGEAPPPETNDGSNDVRLIRTRSNSELRFVDSDQPSLELKLASGKRLLMDDSSVVLEDGTGNRFEIETNGEGVKIVSIGGLCLQGVNVEINASASMDITTSGTLTIQGAMVQIN